MNTLSSRAVSLASFLLAVSFAVTRADAVEALLLQDTYVDNGTTGGKPPPNASNYGSGIDLRVFKGSGRIGRTFLKFSLATLPPGTLASDVSQARLRFWVNSNSTVTGAITLSPVTAAWDEYALNNNLTSSLSFGAPKLIDLPVTSVNNFISVDVTAWVKAWLSGSLANEGIEMEAGGTTTTLNLAFDSKESNQTSHEPRLEISLSRVGAIGPIGPMGPIGPQGIAGPTGPAGANGSPGQSGPAGPAGSTGLQGIAGNDGTKWFSFSGPPAADLGALSDYYLNLANGDVWRKVSTADGPIWTLQGNIRGAIGATGVDGVAGSVGPAGPQGPAGMLGPPGPAGVNGDIGPMGPMGPIGAAGPAGPAAVWPTRIAPQGDLAMGEFTQGSPP
jgi:hypothetical protein